MTSRHARPEPQPPRAAYGALALAALVALLCLVVWWLLPADEAPAGRPVSAGRVVHAPSFQLAADVAAELSRIDASPDAPERLEAPAGEAPAASAGFDLDVVDTEGRPVSGARVTCTDIDGLTAASDAGGHVHLLRDPFESRGRDAVTVSVTALCYRPARERLVQPARGDSLLVAGDPPPPPRLVLHRCAVLQVVLEAADRSDEGDVLVRLRGNRPLFEAGLAPGDTGAVTGTRQTAWFGRPQVDAAELERGGRVVSDGAPDERLYDLSAGGTRLLVGLQPGAPLELILAGRYGEPLSRQTVTLADDEWRRLTLSLDTPRRTLTVSVHAPDGSLPSSGMVALHPEGAVFTTPPSALPSAASRRPVELKNLRAEHVSLRVTAEGFLPRLLPDVRLEPGDNALEVELQPADDSPAAR